MRGSLLVLFAVGALSAAAFAQPNPPVPPTWPFDHYQLKEIGGEWQWVERDGQSEVKHGGQHDNHRNNHGDHDRHSPHYSGPHYYYDSPRPWGYYYGDPRDELYFDGRHWVYRHSW